MKAVKPGDYITFKAATRWSCGKVRRKVVSIDPFHGWPCVRYGGWSEFLVRPHEIIKVEAA